MARVTRYRWPRGHPVFPMTVVGHGRVGHAHLRLQGQRRLAELAGSTPLEWGLLFILDGRRRRWTLYSPDPDYTAMFAPTAHTLDLDFPVFAEKFPGWNGGWTISGR